MDKKQSNVGSTLGIIGVFFGALLCCGGPILLATLGLTSVGAFFASAYESWLFGGVLAILAIIVAVIIIRKAKGK
jgi:hypothetical protein